MRLLKRERLAWADGLAHAIRAGEQAVLDHTEAAIAELEVAGEHFAAAEMQLHVAGVRRQIGRLRGGDRGRSLVEESDAWMSGQGIRDPARMTAMLLPGFPS